MSAKDYEKQVNEIIQAYFPSGKASLTWSTPAEARLHKSRVSQMQKELRLVKKNVATTMRTINSAYTTERTKVGKSLGDGVLAGVFGKKTMGKANATSRDALRRKQIEARAPYEVINRKIDSVLLQLDDLKLKLDSWMIELESQSNDSNSGDRLVTEPEQPNVKNPSDKGLLGKLFNKMSSG